MIASKILMTVGLALGVPVVGFGMTDAAAGGPTTQSYGELPLHFEPNGGQAPDGVKFLSRGSGYALFLGDSESILVLRKPEKPDAPRTHESRPAVLRTRLLGASPKAEVVGEEELPGQSHYLIGNDPSKWRTGIAQFARVTYRGVYPGIDLTYYGNQRQLEYDFRVAPGADPRRIRLRIDGAERLTIDESGGLVVSMKDGETVHKAPIAYQEREGGRTAVDARWRLHGRREARLELGPYDARQPVVIDPVLVYSTYLGGGGIETGWRVTVDASGSAYISGSTNSADFPTAAPYQAASGGGTDAFVTKLNAAGTAVVYSTYLGGVGDDLAFALAVDSSGNAYVVGETTSSNFPVVNALQSTIGGGTNNVDCFVAKLNAAGSALLYSTYLGGTGFDSANGIAIDASGNMYVTGATTSPNMATPNAPHGTFSGGFADAFVAKLNAAGSALTYFTYLGGAAGEWGDAIAVDGSGNAYVSGYSDSTDFPTVAAFQPTFGGGFDDGFIAKLNAAGTAFLYTTYLGGSGDDIAYSLAIDSSGNAYVTGFTSSTNFPTKAAFQPAFGGGPLDAYVAKLNAAGSALVYSTYLGGSGDDAAWGIAVDSTGHAYVTGQTTSTNFQTSNAPQSTNGGGIDVFVTKLNISGQLAYSTYLGGGGDDRAYGLAADNVGHVVVTGQTTSTNLPTLHPVQPANGGGQDAFVAALTGQQPAIFLQNTNGSVAEWFMNGTQISYGLYPYSQPLAGWTLEATGDFNNDGNADLLLQDSSGAVGVWLMNDASIASAQYIYNNPLPGWTVRGTGDFDGDGKTDIVVQYQDGRVGLWLMNGTSIASSQYIYNAPLPGWTVRGVGDFNGDGKPDILIQYQDGSIGLWLMNGTSIGTAQYLYGSPLPGWTVRGTSDYNSDGKTDVLLQNTDGSVAAWLMNGTTIASGIYVYGQPLSGWTIRAAR